MDTEKRKYCGRFAPSPSGPLHFGSLVAAMGSYLDARHNRGEWLVRIEDLDPPREKPGSADGILTTLEAFGFEWDREILYQNCRHRTKAYREALDTLSTHAMAFLCACTRREINATGLLGIDGPIYPGTCRNDLPEGREARTIRVRTDDLGISFLDLVCGEQQQKIFSQIGDFVIRRADGLAAYQLAVVVDDAFQGVNRVVRGADLLYSTPRQIYLQQLLKLPTPEYAHLPLVRDGSGRKLSKQSRSLPVDNQNPLPALVTAWQFLGQIKPDPELQQIENFWQWAIVNWDLSNVPCEPSLQPTHHETDHLVPGIGIEPI